jgi:hypothetical protein
MLEERREVVVVWRGGRRERELEETAGEGVDGEVVWRGFVS